MSGIVCLAIAGLLSQGLDARGRRHTAPLAEYLTFTLASDRETYWRGEALALRLAAENRSDVPVRAHLAFHPQHGYTTIYYRRVGTAQFTALELVLEHDGFTMKGEGERTVYPTKHHSVEVSVSLTAPYSKKGARHFILDQVGRYEFKARHEDTYADPNGVLESNVLAIEVVEPPASEQEAQAAYTPDLAHVAHLYWGETLSPEETRAAAEFVERFAGSLYAGPVRTGLKRSLVTRRQIKQATEEEQRLYERLTADDDPTRPPDFGFWTDPQVLWPADKAMVLVTAVMVMNGRDNPRNFTERITLESISCDDSCDMEADVLGANVGTDDREFALRANRGKSGDGRTYTITYSATNAAGKRRVKEDKVIVPSYDTPPEWSPAGVRYRPGEPVMYRGEVWRTKTGSPSRPDWPPPRLPGEWTREDPRSPRQ